ncbi:phage tail protein [Nocardioides pacificus]
MAESFLGEIRMFSFVFAPQGWALCNGQLLPINQNQALFALLGTTFGGDGRVNFALPDLRGRSPMHVGGGHTLGERGGEQAHTVSLHELPTHSHAVTGRTDAATAATPVGNLPAAGPNLYTPGTGSTALVGSSVSDVGGSQAHENRQPFLTTSHCIALQGIFPSRN